MLLFVLFGVLINAALRSAAHPAGPGRPGPGGIVFTAAHDTAVVPLVRSEVCYLDLYAFDDEMDPSYAKEVLVKDESDRDVYINDGYKKDADVRQFYYIEHCYRSGHLQSDINADQAAFDDFPLVGPFASGAGNLDIGAGLEKSAAGFGGNSGLVFGISGRSLYKRQNGTAQDDNSALDDLNRVSEAIGGSDNVLDLSSGAGDASLQSPAGSAMGDDGTAEGAAPEGVFGQDSPLGFGLGGRFSPPLTFSIPLVLTRYAATGGRPARKPTPTSTGPKIVKLSTVDAQTAVVHSDSRQSHTAAFGADPFFATPSVFVAATPSLGPAPGSLSPPSLIGTLGSATSASLSSSPLTLDPSSTSPPTSQSLFVTVGGAPSPTGSVTTIVH